MKINVKPRFFIFLLIFLYVVVAAVYLLNRQPEQITFKTPEGETAETVEFDSQNEPRQDALQKLQATYKNKLTIIFFYDGYENQQQALAYINLLKETLKPIEPFKSGGDYLLYKSFTTDSQKCSVKNNVLICDEKLIDSFRNLGVEHFKLVILSPLEFENRVEEARGRNSWMTISTHKGVLPDEEFNRFLGAQFAQSVGRSLGLSLENTATPSGAMAAENGKRPNCAESQEAAESFWGAYLGVFEKVGIFVSCRGNGSFFYPEQGTIMSDNPTQESYGVVSEDYLRGVLQCFYGNINAIIYPAGRQIVSLDYVKNCDAFKSQYPKFWEE